MSRAGAALAAFADRHPFAGFSFLFLGSTAGAINYQAPSVIFDAVMQDLHMSSDEATFIQTLFIACLGASLILTGSLGDEIGQRKLCLVGLVGLMAANLLAAFAPAGAVLLLARALQGIGMAAFLSTMVGLCSSLFADPRQKATAFSLFGASVGVAVASANLVGEACLRYLDWRSLFLVIEPLFLLSFLGILFLVREKTEYSGEIRFDTAGAALLSFSLLSLIFALSEGAKFGWLTPARPVRVWGLDPVLSIVFWLFVASAVSLAMFHWHQVRRLRRGQYVTLDYTLFHFPSFTDGVLTTGLYFAGALGLLQIWPSILTRAVTSLTPLELAYLMAGMGISFTASSLAASILARSLGAKNVVLVGIVLNIACLALLLALLARGTVGIPLLAAILFVYGGGYGLVFTKLTYLAVAAIDPDRSSAASGILLSARQTSAAIGAAILVALVEGGSSFAAVNGAACVLIALSLAAGLFLREPTSASASR